MLALLLELLELSCYITAGKKEKENTALNNKKCLHRAGMSSAWLTNKADSLSSGDHCTTITSWKCRQEVAVMRPSAVFETTMVQNTASLILTHYFRHAVIRGAVGEGEQQE